MRTAVIVILALLAGCAPAAEGDGAPPEKPKAAFGFRGITSGVTTLQQAQAAKVVEGCEKGPDPGKNDTYCDLASYDFAGVPTLDEFVIFENGVFTGKILEIHTNAFDEASEAVTEAYGLPCKADSQPLQNMMGARFSGDVLTWCFANGELSLTRHMKEDVTHAELQFSPYRQVPERAPFTPDKL